MKKLLFISLALLSFKSFSQSYLVLNNGVTLTTDRQGFVYDFNNFVLPYKVNVNGGQFLVEDERLITIEENGFLYRKENKIKKVKGKGHNYFINDGVLAESDILYTIDSKGYVYKWTKDVPDFKKANKFGGNFFVVTTDKNKKKADLYSINSKGNYFKLNLPDLNPFDISAVGGTYFTAKGTVYTVSRDGFVYSKKEIQVGSITKLGGNFFIDDSGKIFTVSEEGLLILPSLPINLKITDIKVIGSNYMIDAGDRIFLVGSKGDIFERTVNHDLSKIRIIGN